MVGQSPSKLHMFFRFTTTYPRGSIQKVNERLQKTKRNSYPCQYADICGHVPFIYQAARDTHERKIHNVTKPETTATDNTKKEEDEMDYKFNYMKASLSFNLFLRDINDAIREGDGARLIELYRVALLYFKTYGHTKYSFTLMKLFFRMRLEPENAFRLIWDRFVNTKGKKGHNISLDLHLEHLNHFLKELLKGLRSNIDENNARRIAESMGNMKKIVDKVSEIFELGADTAYRKKKQDKEDVIKLAMEYNSSKLFEKLTGREFPSFPKFSNDLFSRLDMDKLAIWIKEKETVFTKLYSL